MNSEKWRQRVMITCFAVLILAMGIVFIRWGVARVFIKHLHQENAITQLVFHDDPNIGMRENLSKEKKIDWVKEYPFSQMKQPSSYMRAVDKLHYYKNKIFRKGKTNKRRTDIEEWTTKHFWQYPTLVELGRQYENIIGWNIWNPSLKVAKFPDGSLTFIHSQNSQKERVESVSELADFAKSKGVKFFFVQAPSKVDAFGDKTVNGKIDFSNQNADKLLIGLREHGIDVLDLRSSFHEIAPTSEDYHRLFYRTDHHWKPQSALFAADLVAQRLEIVGIPMDRQAYDSANYTIDTYPSFFLGSQGKKVTLAKTKPDDFDIVKPDFPVNLHVEMPSLDVDATGDFDLLLDPCQIERKDYYNLNPYAFYGRGDMPLLRIVNLNQRETGKKVLMIRDSFSDTLVPYLALGCRQIITLDLRHFTGSVQKFIEQEKPDVVVVMYTIDYSDKINWKDHKDEFDFR